MSELVFEPWRGDNYGKLQGKKVLILGESYYEKIEALTAESTRKFIEAQINGDWTKAFFTKLASAISGKKPENFSEKREFWHSVAYHVYVPMKVGSAARERPTSAMWESGRKHFPKTLQELEPQCIIVLGYSLWANLPHAQESGPTIGGGKIQVTKKYLLPNGSFATAYAIHHPSFPGFSPRVWHPRITKAIELC